MVRTSPSCAWLEAPHKQISKTTVYPVLQSNRDDQIIHFVANVAILVGTAKNRCEGLAIQLIFYHNSYLWQNTECEVFPEA